MKKYLIISLFFVMLSAQYINAKDYHVKQTDEKLRWAQVVFHIHVPDETNFPGLTLFNALYQYLGNDTILSQFPNLATDENDSLQNCYLYEHVETITFTNLYLTPIEKRAEIDALYSDLAISIPNRLRKILKYWGLERNVP